MPGAAQYPAQRRAGAVGHDQLTHTDPGAVVEYQLRDAARRIMVHINHFDAEHHLRAIVGGNHPDPVVELGAGDRAAGRGK
jgi:hypothetical protein